MRLTLVSASAGTGKTERISRFLADALSPGAAEPTRVEGLVAVTFTRHAASELVARVRQVLVNRGAHDVAYRLPLAYIGTVHAVCLRLLQEFAFEAGLSPRATVMPEGEATSLLAGALEEELELAQVERLEALAHRLRPNHDAQRGRSDWLADVRAAMTLARENALDPAALAAMAERSSDALVAYLDPPDAGGGPRDARLRDALDAALAALTRDLSLVKARGAHEALTEARRQLDAPGGLPWQEWARLGAVDAGKVHRESLEPVRALAAAHLSDPRLHADVRDYARAVADAAARGLARFAAWKDERRWLDYTDMEARALALLELPAVRARLAGRLELVVVDEFQDTSPLQLALFLALGGLARRSLWVGDRKQSIYGFRGADPALMDAATAALEAGGGRGEVLGRSFRSRPALVRTVSHLFAAAFARHGHDAAHVRTEPERVDGAGLAGTPAFGVWHLDARNVDDEAEALAEGVRRLLAEPARTPVLERAGGGVRPLRASDVAVLCARHQETQRLAAALGARGIAASVARPGLLATPEGTALLAGLRLLCDPRDGVARAELEALDGFAPDGREAWLAARLEAEAARVAAREAARAAAETAAREPAPTTTREATGAEAPARTEPAPAGASLPSAPAPSGLGALQGRLAELSPVEAVDALLEHLELPSRAARWPRARQRLANLQALREAAAAYESGCDATRRPATVAGLVHHLGALAAEGEDAQATDAGDEAVRLSTYHAAKGLEWPVVVLSSLDRPTRSDPFGVSAHSAGGPLDAAAPLAGRWLRTWCWPHGGLAKTALAERVEAGAEHRDARAQAERESLRLLYVGWTRARDHLVLAARRGKDGPRAGWLDALGDAAGPLLSLPAAASGPGDLATLGVRGLDDAPDARVWTLGPAGAADADAPAAAEARWFVAPTPGATGAPRTAAPPPHRLTPSSADAAHAGAPPPSASPDSWSVARTFDAPPARAPRDPNATGNAVHAFLASHDGAVPREERVADAHALATAYGAADVLDAAGLVDAAEAFERYLDAEFPAAARHAELPVAASVTLDGVSRRVEGRLDLALEDADGWVVVDHKTELPADDAAAREDAAGHAAQLELYARALEAATDRRVRALLVHFPRVGRVALHPRDGTAATPRATARRRA